MTGSAFCARCNTREGTHAYSADRRLCGECWTQYISARQWAYGFDALVWHLGGVGLFQLSTAFVDSWGDVTDWIALWTALALCRALLLLKDGYQGCSPGKWLCDLRVVRAEQATPIDMLTSLGRNFYLFIPILGELIALVELSFGPRFGDRLCHTRVAWLNLEP